MITKELEEQQEKQDISQHQPLISAYNASNAQDKESQSIIQNTQTTQEKGNTISQNIQITSQDTQHTSQDIQTIAQDTQTIKKNDARDTTTTAVELKKAEEKERKIQELSAQTKKLQKLINPQYTQHTHEQLQSAITNLSPQTKAKLQSAQITPLDYASFLLSREKIANNRSLPENAAFLDALKNLETTLEITNESAGGYPLSFEPQAKTFKQNPDLQKYAQKSQDFSPLDQLSYFS
ncbi:MAG: hypothetical protein Q4B28_07690 [bacterium]|nr:hypothetical protein [bacterium]